MLATADWLLTALHVAVVLGFLLLWIPRRTVRLHRWVVGLTAASWLGLGATRGLGYCVLTDVHWRVKHARGERRLPASFLKYAGDALTSRDLPPRSVDAAAGVGFLLGVGAAAARWRRERAGEHSAGADP